MGHYRKIDPYIWNDERFMSLSSSGQLACFFMLTHPHMTSVGGLRATIAGVASEHSKLSEKAFQEVFDKGIAKADKKAPLIWFPKFLKHNPPENPNVVKAWVKGLDYLPECETKNQIIHNVKDFLKGFSEGFQKAWPQSLPKQEQEQDKEEPNHNTPFQKPKKKLNGKYPPPSLEEVTEYFRTKGYSDEAARKAYEYYEAGKDPESGNWKDARGNIVKAWKQKMHSVWFKPENEVIKQPRKERVAF